METTDQSSWRKCSTCKKPIAFGGRHYVCSVSSCNGQRTGYVFCSMSCFEAHVPGARHRDAGAIEKFAPKTAEAGAGGGARIIVRPQATGTPVAGSAAALPNDILIIASRLKEFIQARGDMNTSGGVMDVLSDHVRIICDRAIDNARAEGRKTVMDRDFDFLKKA